MEKVKCHGRNAKIVRHSQGGQFVYNVSIKCMKNSKSTNMPALPFLSGDIAGQISSCFYGVHHAHTPGLALLVLLSRLSGSKKKILHSRLAARNRNFARTQTIK